MVHQGLTRRTALGSLALLSACAAPPVAVQEAPNLAGSAPPALREFRAAWVATVANIDWPSRKGLSAAEQQAEIDRAVALAAELGLNALIVQVRTSADALYPSALEPWSEYLSGTQGVDPGYDPLAHWLRAAHARGIELHAWINPYRARQSQAQSDEHASHLSRTQPDWVKRYGKQLWMDPGEPGAAAHTLAVCRDLLTRYALDGLHIDDYFYPYPEKDSAGNPVDFPDEPSYSRHGQGAARADWRRANVDNLVKALYALVHEVRPAARLGVSPFGLMRPDRRPAGISGFSQYDQLFAHVELWLEHGWMDYLVPQLYWPRAQEGQAFAPLLKGWMQLNPQQRPLYAGLFTSRLNATPQSWQPEEVEAQIALTRELNPAQGHVHFSMAALLQNRHGIAERLRALYAQPALPPASPWLTEAVPGPTTLHVEGQRLRLEAGAATRRLLLHWRHGGAWRAQVLGPQESFPWPEGADALVASAFNSSGAEGPRRAWTRP